MTGLLHAANPLNWHWHHSGGYVVGGSVTTSIFGALTADQVTAWGGAVVAILVSALSALSAYKEQKRNQGARDAINKANLAAIRQRKPVPFPDYLPPAISVRPSASWPSACSSSSGIGEEP